MSNSLGCVRCTCGRIGRSVCEVDINNPVTEDEALAWQERRDEEERHWKEEEEERQAANRQARIERRLARGVKPFRVVRWVEGPTFAELLAKPHTLTYTELPKFAGDINMAILNVAVERATAKFFEGQE